MTELEDCISKGLLRKTAPSRENALKSLAKSRKWLIDAEGTFGIKLYDPSILAAYEAIFHSARSLLIKDGYRERSHYCIARYLDQIYAKNGTIEAKVVDIIDGYRDLRQQTAYNIEFEATKEEADSAIKNAEFVIKTIAKIL